VSVAVGSWGISDRTQGLRQEERAGKLRAIITLSQVTTLAETFRHCLSRKVSGESPLQRRLSDGAVGDG
jgi:hypothetical protein